MKLTPVRITRFLLYTVATLLVMHLSTVFAQFVLGRKFLHGLLDMFSLDEERNVPTLYSVTVIVCCAITTWIISRQRTEQLKKIAGSWKLLSFFVLFLALDEGFSIHELANRQQVAQFIPHGNGFFFYTWVVPYFFLVLFVGAVFFRFIKKLPVNTRLQFLVAGAMFVGGALGMELIGGKYRSIYGNDAYYYLIVAVEETLEMLAMVVFLNALLKYYLGTQPGGNYKMELSLTSAVSSQTSVTENKPVSGQERILITGNGKRITI